MYPLTPVINDINIDGFHNIYYFEFGKYHAHSEETHDFWEMVYVDKGKIVAITDGVRLTLEEGQAIFHKPYEAHAHISNRENANNMLIVSFSCNSDCMDYFNKQIFTLDKTSKTLLSLFIREAKEALGKIPGDFSDKTPLNFSSEAFGSSQLMKYHFTEFMIKLLRKNPEFESKSTQEERTSEENTIIDSVIAYLKQNVYSTITLNDICDNFFVRKSHLSAIFKNSTGKSLMQYYSHLKIEEAKKLLREDNFSVSEITDILKYSGIHNFSRAFKNITGFSPTGYKKSILLHADEKHTKV